ncbi:TetR/AcrR family transcriptional regulator C-terminal domain-containing protein [Actinoplanes regularis]|uniref:Transcriptional regulator, TetR family n=1 Tax=Actinoplanes regularis TaxID=52697 RepID=A0A239AIJ9_9ACTN|nr:TetR/AcrR family transcriptional regulator C-terminal domain-containing protein [Actinoplanes regularis]GIE91839.1 GntR family transcriptional regulator [Actinoplanes regularis]SNR95475.1 transcriptional regulator, TetR family [Actinoplanes regularis]
MEEPVYKRIAGELAARITSGELAPGTRIPSTRQIMAAHGVAMATATRVITHLREQGLVAAQPGIGTVVTGGPSLVPENDRDRIVRTAIGIADAEGLGGLSMRRLAGALRMPTMSLYRYVADKDELVLLMMDQAMAEHPPPPHLTPGRDDWRVCVEGLARLQWSMYRRHKWLAQAVSFTRPPLAIHAMAHTEWTMRAIDEHGLSPRLQFQVAVMVANHVRGTAINLEAEAQAEQETGMTDSEWFQTQENRFAAVLATGRLPMMSRVLADEDYEFNLDILVEFGLQRLLDGLERLIR